MGLVNINLRHSESIFGLDIGHANLKIMQLKLEGKKPPKAIGYGMSQNYPVGAIKNGEIVDHRAIASALNNLLQNRLVGSITASRVACALPTAHTFSRPIRLPKMPKDHLEEAIQLETEQYIPLPADKLYLDYEITSQNEQNIDLLVAAAPKNIVDSYMKFLEVVGLAPAALEPSTNAIARLFKLADPSHNQPSILVDFGSIATDISVFDSIMLVNSTVASGGDIINQQLAKRLGISPEEAFAIKNEEGINQGAEHNILPIIRPMLDNLVREIKRIIRYYDDRIGGARKISQVITAGGGATLKGLNEYLLEELKIPVRLLDPWQQIDFGNLEPPDDLVKPMYLTVAGEAILSTEELHHD